MLGLALLLAVRQSGPPPVLPPWAEMNAPLLCSGPPTETAFAAGLGGLLNTVGGTHGPSHGVFANRASLELLYMPTADLRASSAKGGAAYFRRSYRSNLAFQGKHSPGLPVGWTHSYDVVIEPSKDTERWRSMRLLWPNGAVEKLSPMLDGKGLPTGEFAHDNGQPFVIRGEPGKALNEWRSVTILWKGFFYWKFDNHASGVMVLRETGNSQSSLVALRMGYDPERRLLEVTVPEDRSPVMNLTYADGLLSRVADRTGIYRLYTYTKVGDANVLWKISSLAGQAAPVDETAYAYAPNDGALLLNAVSIPDPTRAAARAGPP